MNIPRVLARSLLAGWLVAVTGQAIAASSDEPRWLRLDIPEWSVGMEAEGLIEDIKLVSGGDSGLSPETRKTVGGLTKPVKIQVFVTPTCPYCARAVMLAHQLAVESDLITSDMVEVSEFPHLGTKYEVMGVPRTVIDETIHIEGAVPEPMLMQEFAKLLN